MVLPKNNSPMLPDGFTWQKRWQNAAEDDLALVCGTLEVAAIMPKLESGYVTYVNRHLPYEQWRSAHAPTLELGQLWVEKWAVASEKRLRAAAAAYVPGRRLP